MFTKKVCWILLVGYMSSYGIYADSDDIEYPTLNSSWSYCFEYTWMGPEYTEITPYNGTCDDYKDEFRAGDDIPCSSPLVIGADGSIPDIEYLWTKHKASVLCRRAPNQACVTYTYWDHSLIINQTHMCARVKTDKGTIPSECYKQKSGNYEIEICICSSGNGLNRKPCNSDAATFSLTMSTIVVALLMKLTLYLP